MKTSAIVGIVLIVIGGIALAYEGISWTTEEEVAEIGPIEATVQEEESIPLPPIVGGIALGAGVILLLAGRGRGD
jgi:hypothetical protein